ncbi:hypothetical protein [Micromonospora sediminicola]|nr:hypothetical protein [Micromonospora sediminicola]
MHLALTWRRDSLLGAIYEEAGAGDNTMLAVALAHLVSLVWLSVLAGSYLVAATQITRRQGAARFWLAPVSLLLVCCSGLNVLDAVFARGSAPDDLAFAERVTQLTEQRMPDWHPLLHALLRGGVALGTLVVVVLLLLPSSGRYFRLRWG